MIVGALSRRPPNPRTSAWVSNLIPKCESQSCVCPWTARRPLPRVVGKARKLVCLSVLVWYFRRQGTWAWDNKATVMSEDGPSWVSQASVLLLCPAGPAWDQAQRQASEEPALRARPAPLLRARRFLRSHSGQRRNCLTRRRACPYRVSTSSATDRTPAAPWDSPATGTSDSARTRTPRADGHTAPSRPSSRTLTQI